MKTCVIIPVHNRCKVTLRCLRHLAATGVSDWAEIVVVDDGSVDDTSGKIRVDFPATTILPGDGNLWWGGAIRLGMDHAMRVGADCLVWLNDDCLPDAGTLRLLAEEVGRSHGIAAGWAATPSGGRYGGFRKSWRGLKAVPIPDEGSTIKCDATAGNCVAFSRAVVETIGLPNAARLPHALLDVDYTLIATQQGFPLTLMGSAICRNEDNLHAATQSWLFGERSPMEQWKLFRQPHSTHGYSASFRLHTKHWRAWGLWLHVQAYLKLALICGVRFIVPLRWLRMIFGKRSITYRKHLFYEQTSMDGDPVGSAPKSGR